MLLPVSLILQQFVGVVIIGAVFIVVSKLVGSKDED